MIFLLKYDRKAGKLVTIQAFPDEDAEIAEESRFTAELATMNHPEALEVVLLEAESQDALRRTHARYFESLSDLSEASG